MVGMKPGTLINRRMANSDLPHSIFDIKSAFAGGSYVSMGTFTNGSELGRQEEGGWKY